MQIKKIVIVGGGTAGWMTACYLNRVLGTGVDITLVESQNIRTVGVGEASFNTIKVFFDYLGIKEHQWMPVCKATYKLAIKFENWNANPGQFYHPFQRLEIVNEYSIAEWWLKTRKNKEPFDQACFNVPEICEANKSPKFLNGTCFDENTPYPYAYHFDATSLAQFLCEISTKRGVNHIVDDVIRVELENSGSIDFIETRSGKQLKGDLFIDCTGFSSSLLENALGEQFLSYSDSLLCDRAIAIRLPSNTANGIKPYTTATALSAGWAWEIPLFEETSLGYVYSSRFISKEEAEIEFRNFLGISSGEFDFLHLNMKVGRMRKSWVQNCVAIGLSAGFVEPLESTGIFLIQYALAELVNHFPDITFNRALINNYNRVIANCYDLIKDFLTLHYCITTRTDSAFWQAAKNDLVISQDLSERLSVWQNRLPNVSTTNTTYHGFATFSYVVMLLGLNYIPASSSPILEFFSQAESIEAFEKIRSRTHQLKKELPSHHEYLKTLFTIN